MTFFFMIGSRLSPHFLQRGYTYTLGPTSTMSVVVSSTVDANVLTSGRLVQMLNWITTLVVLDNNTVRKEAGRKARDTSHEKETSSIRDMHVQHATLNFFARIHYTSHIIFFTPHSNTRVLSMLHTGSDSCLATQLKFDVLSKCLTDIMIIHCMVACRQPRSMIPLTAQQIPSLGKNVTVLPLYSEPGMSFSQDLLEQVNWKKSHPFSPAQQSMGSDSCRHWSSKHSC